MWFFRRRRKAKITTKSAGSYLTSREYLDAQRIFDEHLDLQNRMKAAYRQRKTKGLGPTVAMCERLIAMSDQSAAAWKTLESFSSRPHSLPRHLGFEQLAIIREKEGRIADALRLAKDAKRRGWAGDWNTRITRLQAKTGKG